jgi:hypothetical protein
VGDKASRFSTAYRNISAAGISAIQRGLMQIEEQGGKRFELVVRLVRSKGVEVFFCDAETAGRAPSHAGAVGRHRRCRGRSFARHRPQGFRAGEHGQIGGALHRFHRRPRNHPRRAGLDVLGSVLGGSRR